MNNDRGKLTADGKTEDQESKNSTYAMGICVLAFLLFLGGIIALIIFM
jgi:hypothetical protein